MKREELLRNPEWWLATIQNDLYKIIYDYMEKHKLKKTDIATKLGVSKGYITQVLNGDFDHKVSKLVDLSLAFDKVPIITYMDLENYIKSDKEGRVVYSDNIHKRPIQFNTFVYIIKDETTYQVTEKIKHYTSNPL